MTTDNNESTQKLSRIAEILLEEDLVTESQIKRAIKIQSALEQEKQLSEVLVDLGYTTKNTIAEAVAKHGKTLRIGDMLIEQGLIAEEDLDRALAIQQETKQQLGSILIEQGMINERTLLINLAHQAQIPYIEPSFAMIDQAVLAGVSADFLAKNNFLPFAKDDDGRVSVIIPELHNDSLLHSIEDIFQNNYTLALGPRDLIKQSIEDYQRYGLEKDPANSSAKKEDEGSVVQLVEHLFSQAIIDRASDIHIEPLSNVIRVRFRVDGTLLFKTELPRDLLPKLISRIKILAQCNITEHQRHSGGRLEFVHKGTPYDMRLSCYVTVHGECVVLRVLNKQMGLVSLDELGMAPTMLERYRRDVLDLPTGVVLITGPTGSGKTTTLYSCLDYCNSIDTKLITVEDPVEFTIDGLIQCSTNDKVGRDFDSSLREIVRQDPDIIVLGEIRDKKTAETVIQAALTGHKVYTTFHTEDTIGGLVRLLNMEIEAFLISSTVISVVAQRLLRRICQNCAETYQPTPLEMSRLEINLADLKDYELTKGKGCSECSYTGYHGRIAVYELLVVNDHVKEAILDHKPAHLIRKISCDTTGLVSMREDAIAKVIRGYTTFEEVLRTTPKTFDSRPLSQIMTLTQ